MSWDRTHRRHELVHAVLDDIAATGRPAIPDRLRADVDAEFGDFEHFLREVQCRWYRAFNAKLDALLEDWPADMHAALVRLWHDLADIMPAARFLLDACADHPALTAQDDLNRRRLHAATGVRLEPAQMARNHASVPVSPRPYCGQRLIGRWRR